MLKRLLSYIVPIPIARLSSPYNPDIRILLESGRPMLLAQGARESGASVEQLWRDTFASLDQFAVRPPRSILVLGVGGGDAIRMVRSMFPESAITGVDIDAAMIGAGKRYFGLSALSRVTLVTEDARRYIRSVRKRFDMVVIDLYIGQDIPPFAASVDFLIRVKRLLSKTGSLYFNTTRYGVSARRIAKIRADFRQVFRSVGWSDIGWNRMYLVH